MNGEMVELSKLSQAIEYYLCYSCEALPAVSNDDIKQTLKAIEKLIKAMI